MKKRVLVLALALVIICTMLTSCEVIELFNNIFGLFGIGEGDTNNDFDVDINIGTTTIKPEECKNHNLATKDRVEPTCTTTGLSEGKVCTNCNTVIIEQSVLPMVPHTYDNKYDTDCNVCGTVRELQCDHVGTVITISGREPSCTGTGLTEGEQCQQCGVVTVHQEIISALGHVFDDSQDEYCNRCNAYIHKECPHVNTTVLEGRPATCIQPGLTSGLYCNDCNTIVTAQESTPVAEHKDDDKDNYCDVCFAYSPCEHKNTEILAGHNATCTEKGLTEGEICLDCGTTIKGQTVTPELGHTESDWIVDKEPTVNEAGSKHIECTVCNEVLKTEKIDALYEDENASEGLTFTLSSDESGYLLIDIGSCTDTAIVIPRYYNGKPVIAIEASAFLNNSSITSVTVPEGVVNIGDGAFRGCSKLASITLPSTLTELGAYAFYECTSLTEAVIPEKIAEIKKYTFYSCYNMTNVDMPSDITVIGEYAFYYCHGLKTLSLPSSLKKIEQYAFYDCNGLTKLTFPAELEYIGADAFCSCNNLSNITLFSKVTYIGGGAFSIYNCKINVAYKGTVSQWDDISKGYAWCYTGVVTCTDGTRTYSY